MSLFFSASALAQAVSQNQQMTFEGDLTDNNGNPVNLASQALRFYIIANGCYLYGEGSSTSGDSQGHIIHKFGNAVTALSGSPNSTFSQNIFYGSASGTTSFLGNNCSVTAADQRSAVVDYPAQGISVTIPLGTTPFSVVAKTLDGLSSDEFLKVTSGTNSSGSIGQYLTKSATGPVWTNLNITSSTVTGALGYVPAASGAIATVTSASVISALSYTPLASINGSTSATQSFSFGTFGITPGVSTTNGVHTFNIPVASTGATVGLLSSADFSIFANKLSSSTAAITQVLGYAPVSAATLTGKITSSAASIAEVLGYMPASAGTFVASGPSHVIAALGYTPAVSAAYMVSSTANVVAALGYTPAVSAAYVVSSSANVKAALGYTPISSAAASIQQVLGYIPAASGVATGMASLNGSVSSTQTFAVGSFGINPGVSTAAGVHTINIPFAMTVGVNGGLLSYADYQIFANKVSSSPSAVYMALGYTPIASAVTGIAQVLGYVPISATTITGKITSSAAAIKEVLGYIPAASGVATGMVSLNGSVSSTQTFAVGSFGINPGVSTAAGVHTINIPFASTVGVSGGLLSNSDYQIFANKVSNTSASVIAALGYIPAASGTLGSSFWQSNAAGIYTASYTAIGESATPSSAFNLSVESTSAPTSLRVLNNTTYGNGLLIDTFANTAGGYALKVATGNGNLAFKIQNDGKISVGLASATARLHVAAGSSSLAPFKLTSGTLLSSPQSGTIEYDGANYYVTDNANTRAMVVTSVNNTLNSVNNITNGGNIVMIPSPGGGVVVSSTTASNNPSSGALVVNGGAGVSGTLNVGGYINSVSGFYTPGTMTAGIVSATIEMYSPKIYGGNTDRAKLYIESTKHTGKGHTLINPYGGAVGIGTASPTAGVFEVNGGTAAASTPGASITIVGQNAGTGSANNGGDIYLMPGKATGSARNGYVGIGTSTPTTALEVRDSAPQGTAIQIKTQNAAVGSATSSELQLVKDVNSNGVRTSYKLQSDTFEFGRVSNGSPDATWMTINNTSGNVGIGISSNSASAALHVAGDQYLENTNGGQPIFNIRKAGAIYTAVNPADSLGEIRFQGYNGSAFNLAANIKATVDAVASPNVYSSLAFNTRNSDGFNERMRISSNGNVGIGTNSPNTLLHLLKTNSDNSVQSALKIERQTGAVATGGLGSSIDFSAQVGNGGISPQTAIVSKWIDADVVSLTSQIEFQTRDNGGSAQTRLTIAGNGNVGIGTVSPINKLAVAGNIEAVKYYAGNGTSSTPSISFSNATSTGLYSPNGSSNIGFATGGLERMRLDSSGRLGINTDTPTYSLDVEIPITPNANAGLRVGDTSGYLTITDSEASAGFFSPKMDVKIDGNNPFIIAVATNQDNSNTQSATVAIRTSYGPSSPILMRPLFSVSNNLNDVFVVGPTGNIGLGGAAPTSSISLSGEATRVIAMERPVTTSAGQNLMIKAGPAKSGGTNYNGGDLVLSSGIPTGLGASTIEFKTASGTSSGSGDVATTTKMVITGDGKVGIGNTNPTARLQVSGTTSVDGILFPDGTTQVGGVSLYQRSQGNCTNSVCTFSCTGGRKIIGGGCLLATATNRLIGSYPTSDTTWQCTANTTDTITVYVICMKVPDL